MITDYSKFDYNLNFIYNHNIFKKDFNVGIGTFTPNKLLDIHGNTNINHNLNIVGNLNWITNQKNTTNIIQYIDDTGELKPVELKSYISKENTNKFEWIDNNQNLLLKVYDKRDNITNTYQSETKVVRINSSFDLFVKSKIIINHIFIYKTDYSYNDMTFIKINNKKLINKKNNYYYSLNEPITLNQNSYNQISITSNNVDNNDYYIILIGYYDFKRGMLWNSNHDSNIFIHSNIGVKINNTNSYALNVLGSIQGNKTTITENLNSINIISNNINTSDLYISNNITSTNNKLYINTTNISIGTTKNTSFCSVGDNTTFSLKGKIVTLNTKANEVEIKNKLFNHSKYNINDNLIQLNNIMIKKPSGLLTKHQDNEIYLKNNVNIKNTYSNSKLLDVKGKITVSNNLVISNNFNIKNLSNIPIDNIESNILKNKGYINVDRLLKSKKLDSRNTTLSYIKVPTNSPISNKIIINYNTTGVIYYNNYNDSFHGITKNKNVIFSKIKKNLDLNLKSFDLGNLLYSSINNIITQNLNVNKKINLPKRSLYKTNNSSNFNKNDVGSIRFNSSALCGEIYNGYKWSKIKYENSDSEIKNIILRSNINNLNPPFNPRITNYTATFINPSQIYLINSPYHKLTITQNNQNIFDNVNNTSDFIPFNYSIISNYDLIIKSESINNNLINISYNIKF